MLGPVRPALGGVPVVARPGELAHGQIGGERIALHLHQGDGPVGEPAVGVEHAVLAVLPALIGQAGLPAAGIVDQPVAIGVAEMLHPGGGRLQGGPQVLDQRDVAGALGIGAGQGHEQRRGVDSAIIAPERHLPQGRHLALAGLVHDLARRAVAEGRDLLGLVGGQIGEHALGQGRLEPQDLPGGDDGVAAEGRGEPGDARIGIGPGLHAGGEQGEVGPRLLQPVVEQPPRALDLGPVPASGAHVPAGPGGGVAESLAAGDVPVMGVDLQIELEPPFRLQGIHVFRPVRPEPGRRIGEADPAGALHLVETHIAEAHVAAVRDGGRQQAPPGALHAAHLEHVLEVRPVLDGQGQQHNIAAVVLAGDPLIEPLLPQEPLALHVQHARRPQRPARIGQGLVRAVEGEEHIVLGDGGRQQRGRLAAQQQAEPRQDPGVVVEQAVAGPHDVAVVIGDDEGVAILQRMQPVWRARFLDHTLFDARVRRRRQVIHALDLQAVAASATVRAPGAVRRS